MHLCICAFVHFELLSLRRFVHLAFGHLCSWHLYTCAVVYLRISSFSFGVCGLGTNYCRIFLSASKKKFAVERHSIFTTIFLMVVCVCVCGFVFPNRRNPKLHSLMGLVQELQPVKKAAVKDLQFRATMWLSQLRRQAAMVEEER